MELQPTLFLHTKCLHTHFQNNLRILKSLAPSLSLLQIGVENSCPKKYTRPCRNAGRFSSQCHPTGCMGKVRASLIFDLNIWFVAYRVLKCYFHISFLRTALHVASHYGFLDIASFLIDTDINKITLNLQDDDGK